MEEQKELERHGLFYTIGYLKGIYRQSGSKQTKVYIKSLFKDLELEYKVNNKHLILKDNE